MSFWEFESCLLRRLWSGVGAQNEKGPPKADFFISSIISWMKPVLPATFWIISLNVACHTVLGRGWARKIKKVRL